IVIFDRVANTHHLNVLQGGNTAQHSKLYIFRETGIRSLDIYFASTPPFGLQEDLMPLLIGKAHNLIFNGGTIARTNTLDYAGIKRGAVQVVTNDLVGTLVSMYQIAGQLRSPPMQVLLCNGVDWVRSRTWELYILAGGYVLRKVERYRTTRLWLRLTKIDGACIDARGGACLKTTHFES